MTFSSVLSSLPSILAVIFLILLVMFSTRIILRHLSRSVRERQLGELQWYQIKPESVENTAAASNIPAQVGSVRAFLQVLESNRPYFGRSIVSVIWNKEQSSTEDGMLRLYVGQDRSNLAHGEGAIKAFAKGLNCRAELVPGPPPVATEGLVVAYRSRYTPNSVEPIPESTGSVSSILSNSHETFGTVFLTMEHMRNSESKRLEAMVTEDSVMRQGETAKFSSDVGNRARTMMSTPVRVSIGAASADGNPANSESMLRMVIGSISTMGMKVSTNDPSSQHNRGVTVFSSLYLVLVGVSAFFKVLDLKFAIVVGVPALALLVLASMNSAVLSQNWFKGRLAMGEIVVPSFIWFNPRYAIHGFIRSKRHDAGGNEEVGNRIAPPSCKQVLTMYPASATEFVSISARSTAAMNLDKDSIPAISMPTKYEHMNPDDLFMGVSGYDQLTSLSLEDIHHNFFVAGAPESGKTNFLQVLFSILCKLSENNSLGYKITPIWVETKGQGAYDAWPLLNSANRKAKFVDSHNPRSGYRLSLEGRRLSEGASVAEVMDNCTSLVSSMQFAWGDGVAASSREALDFAFRIAMLMTPEEIRYLELEGKVNIEKPNIIRLAHYILGGDLRIHLGEKLQQMYSDLKGDSDRVVHLKEAISTLGPYLKKNDRSADERRKAPLNKLSDLRSAETFWTPDHRTDIYPRDIINNFAPVIINLGPYWVEEEEKYKNINSMLAKKLTLMSTHIIWGTIKAECNGWGKAGKRIPMIFDEASDIAPDSDSGENVIAEVGAKARAMGAAFYLGTQNMAQLPPSARHEVLAFRSKVFFQLPNADDAEIVIHNLGKSSPFIQEHIQRLPVGTAIAVIKQGSESTPPFTLRSPFIDNWIKYLDLRSSVKESAYRYMDAITSETTTRYDLDGEDNLPAIAPRVY